MVDDPRATALQALNQDVAERIKAELGNLLQQIIILQAQNAAMQREIERLTARVLDANHRESIPG